MATNDFQILAGGAGANVLTQAEYVALTTLLANGFSQGIVASNTLNKILRQSSISSALITQLIVEITGQNVVDDGAITTLLPQLILAIQGVSSQAAFTAADTGTANTYAITLSPAPAALTPGMTVGIDAIVATNTGASTLNVNGLGALPIQSAGGVALQGGELVATYGAVLRLNHGGTAWILLQTTGGSLPVVGGTKSEHAVNLGQFLGPITTGAPLGTLAASTTYTKTISFTAPSAGFVWGQGRLPLSPPSASTITLSLIINGTTYQQDVTLLPMTDAGVMQVTSGQAITVTAQAITGSASPGTAASLYADAIFIPSLTN